MNHKQIYKVEFKELTYPQGPRAEETSPGTTFYFSSLAAIYDFFTSNQIGCQVQRLWSCGVSRETEYKGKRCTVSRVILRSKAQAAKIKK